MLPQEQSLPQPQDAPSTDACDPDPRYLLAILLPIVSTVVMSTSNQNDLFP